MASKVYEARGASSGATTTQAVKTGQILVKIDRGDYQAALDQAKAVAGAGRKARRVPRSRGAAHARRRWASGNSKRRCAVQGLAGGFGANAVDLRDVTDGGFGVGGKRTWTRAMANAQLAKADLARYLPLVQKGEIFEAAV